MAFASVIYALAVYWCRSPYSRFLKA